ncbi:cell division protein ZapA [Cellvibrio japonicus]|nr:cell division protein ZapA [Cellvibrio japonicus]QEI11014.1 cell division protein ZapA [Cellvibrio japonicus]QEI14589.1 cell division protein ZapA [Cellvibrio japonicus]QEI18168.1 cell division protein ZapA [Cellvibrio japonicus]
MSNETVVVKILDKEYQVACPREERQALLESAQLLDERMKAIRSTGAVIGLERIAVMAALNLSHELLQARQSGNQGKGANQADLLRLHEKLDRSLANKID